MDTKSSNVGEEIIQGGEALEKERIKVGLDVCYPNAIHDLEVGLTTLRKLVGYCEIMFFGQ